MITLIRYKNRKIYSSKLTGYVVSSDMATWIDEGNSIEILQHITNADVTRSVLMNAAATQTRLGNLDVAEVLVSYAMAYRATSSVVGVV
jgi:polyhydroxyalkanoate synthesis regulator protein